MNEYIKLIDKLFSFSAYLNKHELDDLANSYMHQQSFKVHKETDDKEISNENNTTMTIEEHVSYFISNDVCFKLKWIVRKTVTKRLYCIVTEEETDYIYSPERISEEEYESAKEFTESIRGVVYKCV